MRIGSLSACWPPKCGQAAQALRSGWIDGSLSEDDISSSFSMVFAAEVKIFKLNLSVSDLIWRG